MKTFRFKKRLWWVMKSGYCTIMWNGRAHGPSKINPPPTMPKPSLLPKKVMLYIWWDWKGVLYCEVFLKNQKINSSKYCFLFDQLKTAWWIASRISEQKMHNLPSGNHKTAYFFDDQEKIFSTWLGNSESSAIFTKHYTFKFPFISVFTKFSWWRGEKKFTSLEAHGTILCSKIFNILGR